MEGFLIRGWDIILPRCGGPSTLSRGATVAACWLHEPQPISNQAVGLEVPHRLRRFRPGRSPFSALRCRFCRYMEGFLIRGWETILPGMHWLIYEHQPISDRPVGSGFHTVRGGVDPGNGRFRPRVVGVVDVWRDF